MHMYDMHACMHALVVGVENILQDNPSSKLLTSAMTDELAAKAIVNSLALLVRKLLGSLLGNSVGARLDNFLSTKSAYKMKFIY